MKSATFIVFNIIQLLEFFQELFHPDHDASDLYAVILQPHVPSVDMMTILNHPILSMNVCYLEGIFYYNL